MTPVNHDFKVRCKYFQLTFVLFLLLLGAAFKVKAQESNIHYIPPFFCEKTVDGHSYDHFLKGHNRNLKIQADINEHFAILSTNQQEEMEVSMSIFENGVLRPVKTFTISESNPARIKLADYNSSSRSHNKVNISSVFGDQKASFTIGSGAEGVNKELKIKDVLLVNEKQLLGQRISGGGLVFKSLNPLKSFFVNITHLSNPQAGILTSKGEFAAGTDFYTGNMVCSATNDSRRNDFISILALEDATQVTISNKNGFDFYNPKTRKYDLLGSSHQKTIVLNKGDSYVLGYHFGDASDKDRFVNRKVPDINAIIGTHLHTNGRKIVVNAGAWCGGGGKNYGHDIGMDQLVPTNLVGNSYIIARGPSGSQWPEIEQVLVVATKDHSSISVNGHRVRETKDAGQYWIIKNKDYKSNGGGEKYMYISSDDPIYVYQTTAGSDDHRVGRNTPGMFLVPRLNCNGAHEVSISYANTLGRPELRVIALTDKISYQIDGGEVHRLSNATQVKEGAQEETLPNGKVVKKPWYVFKLRGIDKASGIHVWADDKDSPVNVALTIHDSSIGAGGFYSGFGTVPYTNLSAGVDTQGVQAKNASVLIKDAVKDYDYQWYKDGQLMSDFSGKNKAKLPLKTPGEYVVVAKTTCGSRTYPSKAVRVMPNLMLDMDTVHVNEKDGMVKLVLKRLQASQKDITFDYALLNQTTTKDQDIVLNTTATGLIRPQDHEFPISLKLIDDDQNEDQEQAFLKIYNIKNAVTGIANGTVIFPIIIDDDDPEPSLVVSSNTFEPVEGQNDRVVVNFDLSNGRSGFSGSSKPISFHYHLAPAGAHPANATDYQMGAHQPAEATVKFAPGETHKSISFAIKDDQLAELDEGLELTVGSATHVKGIKKEGTTGERDQLMIPITIKDNDQAKIFLSALPVTEGDPVKFHGQVMINGAEGQSQEPITFQYYLKGGSAEMATDLNAPKDGAHDFVGSSAVKTFTVKPFTKSFELTTCPTLKDRVKESAEVFSLFADHYKQADAANSTHQVDAVINDKDAKADLVVASMPIVEGDNLVFHVHLTKSLGANLSLNYELKPVSQGNVLNLFPSGNATHLKGTLLFKKNQVEKVISIPTADNNIVNGNHRVQLHFHAQVSDIFNPKNTVFSQNILDNDVTPVAKNDQFTFAESDAGAQYNGDVSANDLGKTTTPRFTVSASDIDRMNQHGKFTFHPDGTFEFSPFKDYYGVQKFGYALHTNVGTVHATAVLEITNVNDMPAVRSEQFSINEGQKTIKSFVASGLGDGGIHFEITNPPVHGQVKILDAQRGEYQYIANQDGFGDDPFQFTVKDRDGDLAEGTITMKIAYVNNHPPHANDDQVTINTNDEATVDVLANDTDADGQAKLNSGASQITQQPQHGKADFDLKSNQVIYVPEQGFAGVDHFTYRFMDALDAQKTSFYSNEATVTVRVKDVEPPMINAQDTTIYIGHKKAVRIASKGILISASDNSKGKVDVQFSQELFQGIGDFPVLITATDPSGNRSKYAVTVHVKDQTAPVFTPLKKSAVEVNIDAQGHGVLALSDLYDTVVDNVDPKPTVRVFSGKLTFGSLDLVHPHQEIQLEAVDQSGNQAILKVPVEVKDHIAPVVKTKNITIKLNQQHKAQITPEQINNGSFDNSGIAPELSLDRHQFTAKDADLQLVFLTAKDGSGNVAHQPAKVRIIDEHAPNPYAKDLLEAHLNTWSSWGEMAKPMVVALNPEGKAVLEMSQVKNTLGQPEKVKTLSVNQQVFAHTGEFPVVFTINDSVKVKSTVAVVDYQSPQLKLNGATVYLNQAGEAKVSPAEMSQLFAGTTDNSQGPLTYSIGQQIFHTAGTFKVKAAAKDAFGNVASGESVITVIDNIAPKVSLKNNVTVYLNAEGNVSISPAQLIDKISDNGGGIAEKVLSRDYFNRQQLGNQPIALTAIDYAGNKVSLATTVHVVDNLPPVVEAHPLTLTLDSFGKVELAQQVIQHQLVSAKDNAHGPLNYTVNQTVFNEVGTFPVTVQVKDASNNITSVNTKITIQDNIAPALKVNPQTLQLNQTGEAEISPVVLAQLFKGTFDNSQSPMTYHVDQVKFKAPGQYNVLASAIDVSGNESSKNVLITVQDTLSPEIQTVNHQVVSEVVSGQSPVVAYPVVDQKSQLVLPLGSDGKVELSPALLQRFYAGSSDNSSQAIDFTAGMKTFTEVGTYVTQLTATDLSQNSKTIELNVRVVDTLKPTLVLNPVHLILGTDGKAVLTAEQLDLMFKGTTDNSGKVAWKVDQQQFGGVGDFKVKATAVDLSNNVVSGTAIVTVLDHSAPEIQTVNHQVVSEVVSGQSPVVAYPVVDQKSQLVLPLGSDGKVELSPALLQRLYAGSSDNSSQAIDFTAGIKTFTEVGTYVTQLTATDLSQNSKTIELNVRVVDTLKPTLVLNPVHLTLGTDGKAVLTAEQLDLMFKGTTDNSGKVAWKVDQQQFGGVGDFKVKATAVDLSNNVVSGTAIVTVLDHLAPEIQTVNHQVAHVVLPGGAKVMAQPVVNATSSMTITLEHADSIAMTPQVWQTVYAGTKDNGGKVFFPNPKVVLVPGVHHIHLFASDSSGNTSAIFSNVTVIDHHTVPILKTQSVFIALDAQGVAHISPLVLSKIVAGSQDNKGGQLTYKLSEKQFRTVGTHQVMVEGTDAQGNTAKAAAEVRVVDTMAPFLHTKSIFAYLNSAGIARITAEQCDNGTDDNAPQKPALSVSKTHFQTKDLGEQWVSFSAEDSSKNVASEMVKVTVLDTIAPTVLTKPARVILREDGTAQLSIDQVDRGCIDNDGFRPLLSLDQNTFHAVGTYSVTLSAVDQSGNIAAAKAKVKVVDPVAPRLKVKNIIVALNEKGEVNISANDIDDGVVDNADGAPFLALDKSHFSGQNLGANVVVLTAIDASANISKSTVSVTVVDTLAPTAIAKDTLLVLDDHGMAKLSAAMVDGGSHDNCMIRARELDQYKFTAKDVHAHTHQLTVTDQSENRGRAKFTVTVIDPKAVLRIKDFPEQIMNGQHLVNLPDLRGTVEVISEDIPQGTHLVQQATKGSLVMAKNGTVKVVFKLLDDKSGQVYGTVEGLYPVRYSAQASQKALLLPNMITPNNDGVNDTFKIPHLDEIERVSLEVYDRSGKLVYKNADYHNEWGGTRRGLGQKTETFYYKVTIVNHKPQSGFVHVVKG